MSVTIEHFVWGFQHYFRMCAEIFAERLLEHFGPSFDPEVFLVAVRTQESAAHYKACVEPEQHHWITSDAFDDVLEAVNAQVAKYPESRMLQSHPVAQQNQDQRLFRRAVRDIIHQKIAQCGSVPVDRRFFVSWPAERPPFLVVTVLSIRDSTYKQLPTLANNEIWLHECRSSSVPESLVAAAIIEFLAVATTDIVQRDAGAGLSFSATSDEILRRAAVSYFGGLLSRVDQQNIYAGTSEAIFDLMARVAARTYEGAVSQGLVAIADKKRCEKDLAIKFKEPLDVHDDRAFRKLLEVTSEDYTLSCNAQHCFGLTTRRESDTVEAFIEIEFGGTGKWAVSYAGTPVMRVRDRLPSLPTPEVDQSRMISDFQRVFPDITADAANALADAVTQCANQRHGALIVVTSDAAAEAVRLQRDGVSIEPVRLEPVTFAQLTAIDGALICSPDGYCHAFGIILDGIATLEGNRSRGARFNSAVRYVATRKTPTMAIVISEDRGFDILPKLRQAISARGIESHIAQLRGIVNTKSLNRRQQSKLISWLEANQYFLSQEQCDEVNALIQTVDEIYEAAYPSSVRIVRHPLMPSEDFDASRDLIDDSKSVTE
jgi:hypothetical protein